MDALIVPVDPAECLYCRACPGVPCALHRVDEVVRLNAHPATRTAEYRELVARLALFRQVREWARLLDDRLTARRDETFWRGARRRSAAPAASSAQMRLFR